MSDAWTRDVLGAPFEQLTLELGPDPDAGEGGDQPDTADAVATLVRRLPGLAARLTAPLRDIDVLYVHGWSDYFFQRELADAWAALGARFYALDLRDYGRSIRPGRVPGYVTSLNTYDADIFAALAAMGHREGVSGGRRLVLMGHSTGGLTLTLWAARHPGIAHALVLNSPWLESQTGAWGRQVLTPLVNMRARVDPRGQHPVIDLGFYAKAQRELGSLPDSPEGWRPERGFPTHPAWLATVVAGHATVAAGIEVGCPALVMLSDTSTPPMRWLPSMTSSDAVLVVDDIARAALKIGRMVTVGRVAGGIHDLFLSAPGPRAEAYALLRTWSVGTLSR